MRKYLAEKNETYLFIQLPKPSEYPNVLKISAGDYWCIQNNGWSIDSATEIFSEEWISDDEFFVTESEIYGNNKLYHQFKKRTSNKKNIGRF
ncbi:MULTISPECIES: hypothetical protein [unclassified Peribacillus]|uniref:hypothetical protein n=1 Tax=unclassified Peribacillus TaxID=2675266 RepID=UPI001E51FD4E|nr:hypothetical protein [Peribacillus sp. Bi96]